MSEIEIEGEITVASSDDAAYAQVLERLSELDETISALDENAILTNNDFDDTLGWWAQVQNGHRVKVGDEWITDLGDKRADSIIVHKRELTENYLNLDVSPAIVTQTTVSYNPTSTDGENFTRMASEYHELIGEGYCNATQDHSTPNFTAMGATCYNKFKGNVGMCAVIGRIDDVAYTDEELGISPTDIDGTTGMGSSKSCAGGFFVTRRANYSQGRHGASYSIGAETYALNAAEEDGILGTDGYPENKDFHNFRSWTNALHLVGGGRRPATDGILINGFTVTVPIDADGKTTSDSSQVSKRVTMHNGFLNGITIGGSSMAVRHIVKVTNANGDVLPGYTTDGNSVETVGINTSSWSKSEGKNYGFYLLKHGYSPRILHSRGAALFEVPGAKFFNSTGSMPFAISCVNEYTYKDEQQVEHTAHGVPYLDFKIGSSSDFFQNNKPVERPTDTTRSRIGYVSTSNSMNVSSDGAINFLTARNFSTNAVGKTYSMTNTDFSPSSPANLGTADNKWDTIYAQTGTISTSDRNAKTDISDIDEKILSAWGKVNYKVFKFKGGNRKHIGVIAQDIDEAFQSEGLNARDFGIFCEDTDENGNIILGVRYSECLALECAYLRSKIGA